MGKQTYTPINCDFYDRLEAAATLRKVVSIQYYAQADLSATVDGKIVDLYIKDGAEWLKLQNGQEIRLDKLIAVDGEQVPTHC